MLINTQVQATCLYYHIPPFCVKLIINLLLLMTLFHDIIYPVSGLGSSNIIS